MILKISPNGLRFWHPVLKTEALRQAPVEIKLCGVEVVLYRTSSGQVAALDARCPHRKMRLVLGHVQGNEIVCPYHGWRFDPNGYGHSPATPAMKITTPCYEVREQHGAIWLRASGGDKAIEPPVLNFPGYMPLALLHHKVDAPFQLLIDNMAELEHTGSVHSVFGFSVQKMHEIKTELKMNDTEFHIYYEGPQRRIPFYLRVPTGILENDHFVQFANIRFEPVHATYDLQWWTPDQKKCAQCSSNFSFISTPPPKPLASNSLLFTPKWPVGCCPTL